MSKKILRTALIGTAGRAKWVLEHARPEHGFDLVALVDIIDDHLAAARERTGLAVSACFTTTTEAIEAVDLDCLIICTPTKHHVPLAIEGVDAGLAVLMEKGMAPDWASARRLVDHVVAKQGIVCVAQNYRYKATEQTISACLRGEWPDLSLGTLSCVDLIHHRVRPFPRTLDYPFASIWDMSCHHFDSLMHWIGRPLAVTGHAFGPPWSPYSHPANTAAHIEFEGGVRVNYFHGHDSARGLYHLAFHGRQGALVQADTGAAENADSGIVFSKRPTQQLGWEPVQSVPLQDVPPAEVGVLHDFHNHVTNGIEPGISARHNLEVMALCQMFVRSVETGRRIERDELDG